LFINFLLQLLATTTDSMHCASWLMLICGFVTFTGCICQPCSMHWIAQTETTWPYLHLGSCMLSATMTVPILLISAIRLGVYLSLTLSVRLSIHLSVMDKLQIDSSFLFLDGIAPFFGHQFSMTPCTKRCSSIFDLGPLMPKIYSPKFAQNRL